MPVIQQQTKVNFVMLSSIRIRLQPCLAVPMSRGFANVIGPSSGLKNLQPVGRDPEKPVRPLSAYFRFTRDMRKSKGIFGPAAAQQISRMWRELPESSRQDYKNAFWNDKEAYDAAVAEYRSSAQYRRNNLEIAKTYKCRDFAKKTAEAWFNLREDEKQSYRDMHVKLFYLYSVKIEAYKATGALEAWKERVGIAQVEREKKAEEDRQKAKQREERVRARAKRLAKQERIRVIEQKQKEKTDARNRKALAAALRDRNNARADYKRMDKRIKKETERIMAKYKEAKRKAEESLARVKEMRAKAKELHRVAEQKGKIYDSLPGRWQGRERVKK